MKLFVTAYLQNIYREKKIYVSACQRWKLRKYEIKDNYYFIIEMVYMTQYRQQ